MYTVEYIGQDIWEHGKWQQNHYVTAKCQTVEQAKLHRRISGDLVYKDGKLAVDECMQWLFAWEKQDTDSYAQKCIKAEMGYHFGNKDFFIINVCSFF